MKDKDKQISFQYYDGNIKKCRPIGFITISQFVQVTQTPKHPEIFYEIAEAKAAGNETRKAILKESLYSFTPAVIVNGWRNQKSITSFTGLFPVDFDKMTPAEAIEFKHYLFTHFPFFYSVWLSASRHGVRGFIQVPVVQSVEEYRSYYYAIESEFTQYEYLFDKMLKNPVLPMFQSYDPDILHRPNPETWTIKAEPPKPAPKPVNMTIQVLSKVSDRELQFRRNVCLKGLQTSYMGIKDVGHPNIRSIALRAGGFAGAGYFTIDEIESLLNDMIDGHSYLRQKAETYKTTARWAITEGFANPLHPTIISNNPTKGQIDNFLTK